MTSDPTAGFTPSKDRPVLVIEPRSDWQFIDLRELKERYDLLYFMTLRGIKARYAQSALGIGWAVFQPVATMAIFTLIFSRVAKISIPWEGPYALFAFCGIVPWTFFSGALTSAATSLSSNAQMISKIYFPRAILPLSNVFSRFVDLGIALLILGLLMAYHGVVPRPEAIGFIPLALLIATAATIGLGLWLSSMAVQYRDVAYGLSFLIQIGMYLTPVIYDVSMMSAKLRYVFGLNPMTGVITTFRAVLLGMYPVDGILLGQSVAVSALLLVSGAYYFRRSERLFADVA